MRPPRLLGRLGPHDVLVDAPLARRPLDDLVGRAGEVAGHPGVERRRRVRRRPVALRLVVRGVLPAGPRPRAAPGRRSRRRSAAAEPGGSVANWPVPPAAAVAAAAADRARAAALAGSTPPGIQPDGVGHEVHRRSVDGVGVEAHACRRRRTGRRSARFERSSPDRRLRTDATGRGWSHGQAVTKPSAVPPVAVIGDEGRGGVVGHAAPAGDAQLTSVRWGWPGHRRPPTPLRVSSSRDGDASTRPAAAARPPEAVDDDVGVGERVQAHLAARVRARG